MSSGIKRKVKYHYHEILIKESLMISGEDAKTNETEFSVQDFKARDGSSKRRTP